MTMPVGPTDSSTTTAARVAGVGYAVLFGLAIFANFFVRERLVDEDPLVTLDALAADQQLVRVGLGAFIVVFLVDIAVAWALFVLLRPAGTNRSLLAAWFRLVYTVLLGVAATSLFIALQLATDGALTRGLEEGQRASMATLALDAFDFAWLIGLAAFGIHLIMIGRLLGSSAEATVLGALLSIAGLAYILDTAANTLMSNYTDYDDIFLVIVAVPSVLAEFGLTIWLLRRGWGRGRSVDQGSRPTMTRSERTPATRGL